MSISKKHLHSGQAMLIAVLTFGGAILGATTIAGLLMLYQIRATRDAESSAKAIFAADTGVEWALFDYYCDADGRCMGSDREQAPVGTLGNDATAVVTCYDGTGVTVAPCSASTTISAISKGGYSDAKRAFSLDFSGAAAALP